MLAAVHGVTCTFRVSVSVSSPTLVLLSLLFFPLSPESSSILFGVKLELFRGRKLILRRRSGCDILVGRVAAKSQVDLPAPGDDIPSFVLDFEIFVDRHGGQPVVRLENLSLESSAVRGASR